MVPRGRRTGQRRAETGGGRTGTPREAPAPTADPAEAPTVELGPAADPAPATTSEGATDSAADVTAHRNKLQNEAYANITLVERVDASTASGIAYRMAVDRRRPPQRAAAHANEGEIWAVVDGSGEVTTGGRIVETKDGNTVTRRIEGGTVHKVSKGDFLLIPENVPHQVTAFTPELYMVTFEFPRGVKK